MSFPQKPFEGVVYTFDHLAPFTLQASLNAAGTVTVPLHCSYSIHCFTEAFDDDKHLDHHRYTHAGELRAFDVTRFQCSLQLPAVMTALLRGKIYRAKNNNYTYVAQIKVTEQAEPYSVFFDLKRDGTPETPALRMFVQSAYLTPLVVGGNAQSWRFGSLAGQVAGIFEPPHKKPRPQKKKAP